MFLFPSQLMVIIRCAGGECACARITRHDTSLFTIGRSTDQKTHLKGVFQGINCLTWLTQVWEIFGFTVKRLKEGKRPFCNS